MKILFLTSLFPSASHDTNGLFNLSRVQTLRKKGHDVLVIAPVGLTPPERWMLPRLRLKEIWGMIERQAAIPDRETIKGIEVRHPKWFWLPKKWFWKWEATLLHMCAGNAIVSIAQEFTPEVVIASWIHPFGTYAGYLKKFLPVPYLAYAEGSDIFICPDKYPGWSAIEPVINKYVDRVILVSKAMADLVGQKRNLRSTALVVDGYDEELFFYLKPPDTRAHVHLLSIGKLSRVKGHDLLIKAMAALDGRYRLYIIGDGPEKGSLEALSGRLCVKDRVTFVGSVPHETVRAYIASSNLVCMPSRSDALPAAALESMACGRPVVSFRIGGFVDVVIDGFNGYLCEPGSPESLASHIDRAIGHEWGYQAIADWTLQNYGWEKSIQGLLDQISAVLCGN